MVINRGATYMRSCQDEKARSILLQSPARTHEKREPRIADMAKVNLALENTEEEHAE